jgi:hypothetical protein
MRIIGIMGFAQERKKRKVLKMTGYDKSKNKHTDINATTNSLHVISPESIGQLNGTNGITAVDDNYLVTTTSMKVGAYAIAAQPLGSHVVTVKHTKVGTLDTLGTIVVVGKNSDGEAITETLTPTDSATVTGALGFETITSITGVGWVIAGTDNDTLIVGVGAIMPPTNKYIFRIDCTATAVIASETFVTGSSGPQLSKLTGLVAGQSYFGRWSSITMTSGEVVAYFNKL